MNKISCGSVIGWKDSSTSCPIISRVGRQTLHSHSAGKLSENHDSTNPALMFHFESFSQTNVSEYLKLWPTAIEKCVCYCHYYYYCLDRLYNWSTTWQLSISSHKCCHVGIGRPTDTIAAPISWVIRPDLVVVVESQLLRFTEHIAMITKKVTNVPI